MWEFRDYKRSLRREVGKGGRQSPIGNSRERRRERHQGFATWWPGTCKGNVMGIGKVSGTCGNWDLVEDPILGAKARNPLLETVAKTPGDLEGYRSPLGLGKQPKNPQDL